MIRVLLFAITFLWLSSSLYGQEPIGVDTSSVNPYGVDTSTYYTPPLDNTYGTVSTTPPPDTAGLIGLSTPIVSYADSSSNHFADTADLSLALLAVPSSPALTLLGIAPTTIAKPSDPKDFLVSIANATQSLTTLPNSFAMEFAPFLILKKNGLDLSEYLENDVLDNFWQTFTISFATNTMDSIPGVSPATSDIGVAAKFSILRGRIDNTAIQKLAKVDSLLAIINSKSFTVTDSLLKTLPAYKALTQSIDTLVAQSAKNPKLRSSATFQKTLSGLSAKLDSFNNGQQFATQSLSSYYSQQLNQLTSEVSDLTFNRVGFMLDAAAGVAYEFPFQQVDSASLITAAAWLTGSQVIPLKGSQVRTLTLQGYTRLLYNPDLTTVSALTGETTTEDVLDFDVGAKIDFTTGTKLTLSLEYIQRFVLNSDAFDPTYQIAFNGSYQVAPNYQLSMTFGRGFDGTISEGGNLLAGLHLFGTFGNRKPNTTLSN